MRLLLTISLLGLALGAQSQVRVNQVGMTPKQEKTAVVEGVVKASQVKIVDHSTGRVAARPRVIRTATSPLSGKRRTVLDFSQITSEGLYDVVSGNHSETIRIHQRALKNVAVGALNAFYIIRSGTVIEPQYAGGIWGRQAGHADTTVKVHSSAASPGRPEGTVISSPGGWYDAGDYNKYVVNSSYSIGLMLCAYEQAKDYFDHLYTGIPESSNGTADLLDEMMYNLKWLLTMQDPWDGGVYHKLTTPSFEGFVMPSDCHQERYVVAKSTAATLDFAAVMAQSARIFHGNNDYPGFAEEAARAALAAYHWATLNPEVWYKQDEMNKKFQPAIYTGEYGDGYLGDEWFWAATELYLLTGDKKFEEDASWRKPDRFQPSSWAGVSALGAYEWLTQCPESGLAQQSLKMLTDYCDDLLNDVEKSCFQSPSGNRESHFGWGCLGGSFCSPGVAMLFAHKLTGDSRYLVAAHQNADYVLGRNATGYCYVTGFGNKSPRHPHHRISAASGLDSAVPGLLVGGPNPGQQDNGDGHLAYPSKVADESYIDHVDSYASNEIAINWNAELVALVCWLDSHDSESAR